jgi:hypothetical protein
MLEQTRKVSTGLALGLPGASYRRHAQRWAPRQGPTAPTSRHGFAQARSSINTQDEMLYLHICACMTCRLCMHPAPVDTLSMHLRQHNLCTYLSKRDPLHGAQHKRVARFKVHGMPRTGCHTISAQGHLAAPLDPSRSAGRGAASPAKRTRLRSLPRARSSSSSPAAGSPAPSSARRAANPEDASRATGSAALGAAAAGAAARDAGASSTSIASGAAAAACA